MSATPTAGGIEPGAVASAEVAAHLVALAQLPGIGPATLLRWHRGVGACEAWRVVQRGVAAEIVALAGPRSRLAESGVAPLVAAARSLDPHRELERQGADGRRVLVEGTPEFPERLRHDPAPPAVLFADGDPRVLAQPAVAVVGTRNATRAGRDLAAGWGAELAAAGVAVVSGLALGIDAAAHRGALHAGSLAEPEAPAGAPVGVVAAGLDVAYPRRHAELHREVARHGVLLSEVPLGIRPTSWRFPARNRIIAGLADAVVVVESRTVGGSILTAGEGLERGIPVLAVPGHPSAPASAGTNDLLFDGAHLVRSSADVLAHLGLSAPAPAPSPGERQRAPLDAAAEAVLAAIGTQPSALAEVVARCELELEDVARTLIALEAAGRVTRTAGWYEVVAPRGSGR